MTNYRKKFQQISRNDAVGTEKSLSKIGSVLEKCTNHMACPSVSSDDNQ